MSRLRQPAIAALLFVSTAAAATEYRFDTVHTQVFFSANHLGLSNPVGRMRVKSGFIEFDADDWNRAKVDAVIDTASLDMGEEAWNAKLRSGEFLDTGKFPTARFIAERVEKTGNREGVAHGQLTLLGVTHPIDLKITFNRALVDPYTLRYTAGFSAEAKLKRSDFGMTRYLREIGDEVTVRIEVEGLRGADAKGQAGTSEANGS